LADIAQNRTNDGRDGDEFDVSIVHSTEKGFGVRADEIDFAEVQDGSAPRSGGTGGLPALFQFCDPGTGDAAFQGDTEFVGAIVQGDFQH
jgi:hypothetical protein